MTASVPDDFVAFVAEHGARVGRACAEISGNDELARAMRVDMLAAVAARWPRWPALSRSATALVRLQHLLRREARGIPSATRAAIAVGTGAWLGAEPDPEPVVRDVAARAWERGRRVRRQRLVAVGVVMLLAIAAAAFSWRDRHTPDPGPVELPEQVSVLPPFGELTALSPVLPPSPLPAQLSLAPSVVDGLDALQAADLARARFVAAVAEGGLVIVGDPPQAAGAGETGQWLLRRYEDPDLAGARLLPTSLSPDGTLIALAHGSDLLVLDVRTGELRTIAVQAMQPESPVLSWAGNGFVVLPASDGSWAVDVTTGHVARSLVRAADLLTVQGDPWVPLLQLQRAEGTQPSTGDGVRSVLLVGTSVHPDGDTPTGIAGPFSDSRMISGPPWLGDWGGPGWGSQLLALRACDPATLRLPRSVGVARSAVAAITRAGGYVRTVVSIDADLDVLGMLGPRQAVLAAHRDGTTTLLAWAPEEDLVQLLMTVNGESTIALPDLGQLR